VSHHADEKNRHTIGPEDVARTTCMSMKASRQKEVKIHVI
jgi:hypothetical protein